MREWRIGPLVVAMAALAALGSETGGAADPASAPEDSAISFPEGYRAWAHVKSAAVWPPTRRTEAFSGLHNIYANEAAMAGYRTGTFPDGAVIVFDLFELEAGDGTLDPGRRKAVDVMVRDSRDPDGWRFERFHGGSRADRADGRLKAACRSCHLREREGDMVFSTFIE